MTLQQQAYGLIDSLPDDGVQAIIQVMKKMLPNNKRKIGARIASSNAASSKMKAYLRMQELRKETAKYDISDTEREAALSQRFGTLELREIR